MTRRIGRAVLHVIDAFRPLDDGLQGAVRAERFRFELFEKKQLARQRLRLRAGQTRLHPRRIRRGIVFHGGKVPRVAGVFWGWRVGGDVRGTSSPRPPPPRPPSETPWQGTSGG